VKLDHLNLSRQLDAGASFLDLFQKLAGDIFLQ
jgi:hypothetical protein